MFRVLGTYSCQARKDQEGDTAASSSKTGSRGILCLAMIVHGIHQRTRRTLETKLHDISHFKSSNQRKRLQALPMSLPVRILLFSLCRRMQQNSISLKPMQRCQFSKCQEGDRQREWAEALEREAPHQEGQQFILQDNKSLKQIV